MKKTMKFSISEAKAKANAAIAAVNKGVSKAWKRDAYDVIFVCALMFDEFTADEVWIAGLEHPGNARALGPQMRKARSDGLIEATQRFIPSKNVRCHGRPIVVWKSLIRHDPDCLQLHRHIAPLERSQLELDWLEMGVQP